MEIRTSFPRFQEYFTLIVQFKGKPNDKKTTAKMYVGRYFTEKGAFDEVCLPSLMTTYILLVVCSIVLSCGLVKWYSYLHFARMFCVAF